MTPDERRRLARRFRREARTLSRLRHDHLVRVLDRKLRGGDLYFVMEHMPGGSLRDRFAEVAAREPTAVAAFMARAAALLSAAITVT